MIEVLLNQNQSSKEDEKLFEILESNLVQAYLTEHGLEKIRLYFRQLKDEVIVEEIITEMLEILQISPCLKAGDVYISNNSLDCHNNSLLILSVNELYQRYILEQELQ